MTDAKDATATRNDDDAPTDEHWHHSMLQPRVWGLFDVRATLAFLFCFVNLFGWWDIKIPVLIVTIAVFTALESRRITPEVAIRQFFAWLRGPSVPAISARSHRRLERPRRLTVAHR